MSLIKAMQFSSRFRKKFKLSKKPKGKGLKGGMWAKKAAIDKAYGYSTLGSLGKMHQ